MKSTLLTVKILEELNFRDNKEIVFENIKMPYWVKAGVCLFYNTPIKTDHQDSFYIGYGEMREGKYYAVAFRWINSLEELTRIYEAIVLKSISEKDTHSQSITNRSNPK